MDKDKILDYVMTSPANTNPNVLKTMLDDSGSEMNPGYSCTETTTLLTDESVTTSKPEGVPFEVYSGQLSIENITAPSIQVTFNGTSYICERVDESYGAQGLPNSKDWSQYPFNISDSGMIQTESAGTYSVKIETVEEVVETTPCFKKAVNAASVLNIKLTDELITVDTDNYSLTDTLAEDAFSAFSEGRTVVFSNLPLVCHAVYATQTSVTFLTNSGDKIDLYTIDESNGYLVGSFEQTVS